MSRAVRVLNYYGSKVLAARHYPAPQQKLIIEPFAGGAGYSLQHRTHDVLLIDSNPDVIGAWQYLIATPGNVIRRLPLLRVGQAIPLDLDPGARLLIGWNLMLVGARPQSRLVPSALRVPSSFWGESRRAALASIADEVKHWRAKLGRHTDAPSRTRATWFVDPPYIGELGSHYPSGNDGLNFERLGTWCRARRGQVIVCEAPGATWLPFRPHHDHVSAPTADVSGRRRSAQMIWTNSEVHSYA